MNKGFKSGNKVDIKYSHSSPKNMKNSYQNASNNKTYVKSSSNKSKNNNKKLDFKKAYRIKQSKMWVDVGVKVSVKEQDILNLKNSLGKEKVQMYKNSNDFDQCLICEDQCVEGEFAVQHLLCIPSKDPLYENLKKFMTDIPRVCCHECANDFGDKGNKKNIKSQKLRSICDVWNEYYSKINNKSPLNNHTNSPNNNNNNSKLNHNNMHGHNNHNHNHNHNNNNNNHINNNNNHINNNNNNIINNNNNSTNNNDQDRDPFDDGFLICTQLVKTGGADQGGLQVGDVFVEFGHYSKKRFSGLKSIANLVRRSAGKEIPVVVWRKLEQMNNDDQDGAGRTVFQKLALKLKPLQSHDADGGGVLGAVINTYPLPEMKNN